MLYKAFVAGVFAFAISTVQADPASTYQWMITHKIVTAAQVQNGVATVTIGPMFYTGDSGAEQTLCGTLFTYLQGQDSSIQQMSLVDAQGNPVGTYSANTLVFANR
jgi:hypothetical protein